MAKSKKSKKSPLTIIFSVLALVFALVSLAFITMDGIGYTVTIGEKTSEAIFPYLVRDIVFGAKAENGTVLLEPNVALLVGLILIIFGALIGIGTYYCKWMGVLGGTVTLVGSILMFCATVLFGEFSGSIGVVIGQINKILGPGFILMGIVGLLSSICSLFGAIIKRK